jgi:hypothetical protein
MTKTEQTRLNAKMIEDHAKNQLMRFAHLPGFPVTKEAMQDYVAALKILPQEQAITSLVDDLVSDLRTREGLCRCPTAADIRRAAYERLESAETAKRACPLCGGTGYVTVWMIVTYKGKSMVVESSEVLAGVDSEEKARPYYEKLKAFLRTNPNGNGQLVNTAARLCECRK